MESGLLVGNIVAEHIFRFGKQQLGDQFPSPLDIFETSVNRILSDVDVYMDPNAKTKLDIGVEREFIRRLADLKEELAMIRAVLTRQEEILQDLIQDYETNNPDSLEFLTYDQDKLDLPREQLKEMYPTDELLRDAEQMAAGPLCPRRAGQVSEEGCKNRPGRRED